MSESGAMEWAEQFLAADEVEQAFEHLIEDA